MTDVGRKALEAARGRIEPVERRVLDGFSATELTAFRGHLTRFAAGFEAD